MWPIKLATHHLLGARKYSLSYCHIERVIAGSLGVTNGLTSRRALSDTRPVGPPSPVDYDDSLRKPTRLESLPVTGRSTRKKNTRSQNGF